MRIGLSGIFTGLTPILLQICLYFPLLLLMINSYIADNLAHHRSEGFIQIQEEPFVPKSAKGIVQCQVGACGLVEQHPQAGSIARLEYLEYFGAMFIIASLQIGKSDPTDEFVG